MADDTKVTEVEDPETVNPTKTDVDPGTETDPENDPNRKGSKASVLKELAELRKANRATKEKLTQYELERLPEAERAVKRAELAEARVKELEQGLLKQTVAATLKLPVELADRLSGTTEAELVEDAKKLIKLFGANTDTDEKPPTNDATRRGKGPKNGLDMNAFIRGGFTS
jgi:hypothetical protein